MLGSHLYPVVREFINCATISLSATLFGASQGVGFEDLSTP